MTDQVKLKLQRKCGGDISRPHSLRLHGNAAVLFGFTLLLDCAAAADFTVTAAGAYSHYYYSINSKGPNPTLTLVRGNTYTFLINASSIHPFYIDSPGVQNNDTYHGTITYTVPMAASNYTYFCSVHGFGGQILTIAPPTPPPPPVIRLLSLTYGSNLVLRSTGTNSWSINPEYSTNLNATNWFALAVLTNNYLNGTNETICGRPPENAAFIRLLSHPN
jgi:hypothetical protein